MLVSSAMSSFLLCVSLQAQAQCEFPTSNIETSTDLWGEEMSWILYQSPETGGPFPLASFQGQFDGTTTSQTLCLEDGFLDTANVLLSVGFVGRWVERGRNLLLSNP